MNQLAGRDVALEAVEKAQKLLVPVTLIAVADDFTSEHIERRKQSSRSVPFVIVGHATATSFLQRQPGLGALQGLNLALLVYAKHNRLLGRIQVQTHHVGEFLGEFRIA